MLKCYKFAENSASIIDNHVGEDMSKLTSNLKGLKLSCLICFLNYPFFQPNFQRQPLLAVRLVENLRMCRLYEIIDYVYAA